MSTGQGIGALLGAVVGGIIGTLLGGNTLLGIYIGGVIGYAVGGVIDPLTPDINSAGAPLQGLQITSNEIGSPLPDGVGTVKIAGHLLAYGKEYSVAIEEEPSGGKGGGGSESVVTGHNYYMSWCLGIMVGPVSSLYSIFSNEKLVWEGPLPCPGIGGEETIVIEGMGSVVFYFGTEDQAANPKVAEFLTDPTLNSPLRGFCWAFFDNCFIGTFNRMPTMFFIVNKAPALAFSDKHQIETLDYNPAHAIWWILSRITRLPETWLHSGDFVIVAQTLYTEKLGISVLIEQCQNAMGYIENICAHADMVFRYGSDGKFHPKLIRKDYDPLLLPLVDESIVLDEPTISRKSWIDTINELKVQYSEILGRSTEFVMPPGLWAWFKVNEGAGVNIVDYALVRDGSLVNWTQSAPDMIVQDYFWNTNPGFGTQNVNLANMGKVFRVNPPRDTKYMSCIVFIKPIAKNASWSAWLTIFFQAGESGANNLLQLGWRDATDPIAYWGMTMATYPYAHFSTTLFAEMGKWYCIYAFAERGTTNTGLYVRESGGPFQLALGGHVAPAGASLQSMIQTCETNTADSLITGDNLVWAGVAPADIITLEQANEIYDYLKSRYGMV